MAQIYLQDVDIKFAVHSEVHRSIKTAVLRLFRTSRNGPRVIHALKAVNLKIESGERVGIIGRNGAGKSTLLKVMGRIYHPQTGKAHIQGHVCPLFEFSTGFEMDANGWDNIRTRALLLGMSTKEIEHKIQSIADFTHLGEFLDIPVRCYSSGMLLRLAFATSTAVDPDILLLDEVMAAGDAAFIDQAKKRMDHLMERANIVVFVSHGLPVLKGFCERTVWLDRGKVMADGPTAEVIQAYEDFIKAGFNGAES